MKYNKKQTLANPTSQTCFSCIQNINQVILKDDDDLTALPTMFEDVEVLDLDCAERIKAQLERRPFNKTMDITFVISDKSNTNLLLVEFRFNYKNLKNLSRAELIQKVEGAKYILGNIVPINSNHLFVFQPNLVQQARNRLQRMIPQIPNNYIAIDLQALHSMYFESPLSTYKE